MADIELVIKIPEEVWNKAKEYGHLDMCGIELSESIMNGTPLPKGHGRLIDADRLKIDNPLHLSLDIPYVTEDTVEGVIDNAPTIIEKDKLESEVE